MRWEYKTLDELGSISRGRSKHRPRNDETLFGGKFPFVQTADVKKANLYLTDYEGTYNEKSKVNYGKLGHSVLPLRLI